MPKHCVDIGPQPYVGSLYTGQPTFEEVDRAVIKNARRMGRTVVEVGDRLLLGTNIGQILPTVETPTLHIDPNQGVLFSQQEEDK